MSDNDNDIFAKIAGGIITILMLGFLLTVIFGDNTCSKPQKQDLEYGCVECEKCNGTGFISYNEVKIGFIKVGYHNERCNKCNGTGMYRIR